MRKHLMTYIAASALISAPMLCPAPPLTGPNLQVSAPAGGIQFPDIPVASGPSRILELTAESIGDEPIDFSSISIVGTDEDSFQLLSSLPQASLLPAETFTIKLVCSPEKPGSFSANLVLASNDLSEPVKLIPLMVNVTNAIPVANTDSYNVDEDQVLEQGYLALLQNDEDSDGTILGLTPTIEYQPANGFVELNRDGSFVYTPNPDYNGLDFFEYKVTDGFDVSSPVIVEVSVNSVVDEPLLLATGAVTEGPSNSLSVGFTLDLGAMPDPPEFIDISEDPNFNTFTTIAYTGQTSGTFDLSKGDGERRLYVRTRNSGGVSDVKTFSVAIDQTPPKVASYQPFELVEATSTKLDAVDLTFMVAFDETVFTTVPGRSATGVLGEAVVLGGTVDGLNGLSVAVSESRTGRDGNTVFAIHVTGTVASGGTVNVGFVPGSLSDEAGNPVDVTGLSATATLATEVDDWKQIN